MNNNRLVLVAVSVVTTLCAALVWSNVVSASRARELKAELQAKETELQAVSASKRGATTGLVDTGMANLLAQRDAEYAKLREDYDKLREQSTNGAPVSATASEQRPARGGRGNNGNAFLERLRQQDPERYQQIIAARDQRRQRAEEQYQEQMTQLDQRIQTAPTQEEVDLDSQIADTLDHLGQLREQMQAIRSLPDDQRQAQMAEIGPQLQALRQQLGDLRDQDRTIQYSQLAEQLGLKGQDAQTLVQSIPQILKSTQYTAPGLGGPGGFGGFGGGGNVGNAGSSSTGNAQSQPASSTTTK